MVVTPHPPDTPKKDSFERQKPVPEAAHSAKEAISPPEKEQLTQQLKELRQQLTTKQTNHATTKQKLTEERANHTNTTLS